MKFKNVINSQIDAQFENIVMNEIFVLLTQTIFYTSKKKKSNSMEKKREKIN